MTTEPAPLALSRHAHHYEDPDLQSTVEVIGRNDNEGGTVELRLHLYESTTSLNGWREPVPSCKCHTLVVTLTQGEARELTDRLDETTENVTHAPTRALGPLLPFMVDRVVRDRERRMEWPEPQRPYSTACTSACAFGHRANATRVEVER